jgi:GDP-L-fucose synthase
MNTDAKIYIAGHDGLVGSAICRGMRAAGFENLVYRTINELDLTRQEQVEQFFAAEKPDYVILAAAKVGGIVANNTYPAEFIYINLAIETNVIQAAYANGVERMIFLGSSCVYPKLCPQPIKEDYLLTGYLEPTNEPYAVAKISGIKMCQAYNRQYGTQYISLMPTNMYGPHDNYHLENSHVVPAMIRKFHEAKVDPTKAPVTLWGSGQPKRELMYVDDLAAACLFVMNLDTDSFRSILEGSALLNVGVGHDASIRELADKVGEVVGYQGEVAWDELKPDGTPQKLLDVSRINTLGWQAPTILSEGLDKAYKWFVDNYELAIRGR